VGSWPSKRERGAMDHQTDHHYAAFKHRGSVVIDQRIDQARRELWRAYQDGRLSEDEFADTLDRLEFISPEPAAGVKKRPTSTY
jgi:hypothetical protein